MTERSIWDKLKDPGVLPLKRELKKEEGPFFPFAERSDAICLTSGLVEPKLKYTNVRLADANGFLIHEYEKQIHHANGNIEFGPFTYKVTVDHALIDIPDICKNFKLDLRHCQELEKGDSLTIPQLYTSNY